MQSKFEVIIDMQIFKIAHFTLLKEKLVLVNSDSSLLAGIPIIMLEFSIDTIKCIRLYCL